MRIDLSLTGNSEEPNYPLAHLSDALNLIVMQLDGHCDKEKQGKAEYPIVLRATTEFSSIRARIVVTKDNDKTL